MKELSRVNNPYRDDKVHDACGLFGAMNVSGKRFTGEMVVKAMANMHFRSNGLGGGYAVYGLYPEFPDQYALHVMYLSEAAVKETEEFISSRFSVLHSEAIPTRSTEGISRPPRFRRYFVDLPERQVNGVSPDDYVVARVMEINTGIDDTFVFSSGKNMGVFKGNAYPEQIAHFFKLEEYQGYLWTGHGRFPTNTPGWWGGAHPFNILDWTVVHNGEISSYGINRRYLEQFGYACTMETDTEVVAYAVDLLIRRHNLPVELAVRVMAPPLWTEIQRMPESEQALYRTLRQVYGSLLLNGPFTFIIAHQGEMIGLTDRIRLRPMVVGAKDDTVFISSEEAPIHLVYPGVEETFIPKGGEPIVARVGQPFHRQKTIVQRQPQVAAAV